MTLLCNIINNALVNMFVNQFILCEQKRGYAIHLISSGGHTAGWTSPVTERNLTGWSDHESLTGQVGAGGPIPGPRLPRPRSVSTLSEPVHCSHASRTTCLGHVRVISFSSKAQPPAPEHETTEPFIVILLSPYHLYVL